jgi:hypothetical protein
MQIEVEAVAVIPRRIEEVFDVAVDVRSLARFFTGFAPLIPGIREASIDGGGDTVAGSLRTVRLSDGSTIKERVLALDRPRLHRYEMAEMNALQRVLCTNMVSEWRFSDAGGATKIVWRYAIHAKDAARAPAAWLVGKLFRRAMQRCLDNVAAALR